MQRQITDPGNRQEHSLRTVSSGDYSFDAKRDGRYTYCFSNENWSANSKEVSFNVHGIVYVPESDTPSDPLEAEGSFDSSTSDRQTNPSQCAKCPRLWRK